MYAQKQAMASVNAAILVARVLVRDACAGDAACFAAATDRARYCQLLATRTRLPALQVHRVHLAAWLSALPGGHAGAVHLSAEHAVQDVLAPRADRDDWDVAARVLDLVSLYQRSSSRNDRLRDDPHCAALYLAEVWARTPDDLLLVRRLARILGDEAALMGPRPTSARILIVDPEESVMPVLSTPLRRSGFDVLVIAHAEEAEAMVAAEPPDAVVARLDMPLMDGAELCRRLRDRPGERPLPVLLLAGTRSRATERRGLLAGADGVLFHPVDLDLLILRLQRLTAATGVQAGGSDPQAALSGQLADVGLTDLVQIITAGGRRMRLFLRKPGREGEVHIVNGEIIHARSEAMEGDEAFYELMSWREGTFSAAPWEEEPGASRTIHTPVMSLLMEGARRVDENGATLPGAAGA